jgi:hypothetical protein
MCFHRHRHNHHLHNNSDKQSDVGDDDDSDNSDRDDVDDEDDDDDAGASGTHHANETQFYTFQNAESNSFLKSDNFDYFDADNDYVSDGRSEDVYDDYENYHEYPRKSKGMEKHIGSNSAGSWKHRNLMGEIVHWNHMPLVTLVIVTWIGIGW